MAQICSEARGSISSGGDISSAPAWNQYRWRVSTEAENWWVAPLPFGGQQSVEEVFAAAMEGDKDASIESSEKGTRDNFLFKNHVKNVKTGK